MLFFKLYGRNEEMSIDIIRLYWPPTFCCKYSSDINRMLAEWMAHKNQSQNVKTSIVSKTHRFVFIRFYLFRYIARSFKNKMCTMLTAAVRRRFKSYHKTILWLSNTVQSSTCQMGPNWRVSSSLRGIPSRVAIQHH